MKYFFSPLDCSLQTPQGAQNRKSLADLYGFDISRMVSGEQTHSNNVTVVTRAHEGCGSVSLASRLPNSDALITNVEGICLMVVTADCVPILLYDAHCGAAAAIHAGWRGTATHIVQRTIEAMQRNYGTRAQDLRAYIGPCIGPCCYEVRADVGRQVDAKQVPLSLSDTDKVMLNLRQADRRQLCQSGMSRNKIEISPICTCCSGEWPSYRYNKTAQRMGSGIVL